MATTSDGIPPAFERTSHLVAVIAEVERLAARVADAPASARAALAGDTADAAAVATLRLDGSPIAGVPDPDVLAAARPPARPAPAGWAATLRSGRDDAGAVDEQILALEFRGARAGLTADDLAARLVHQPRPALEELHRRVTAGLVDPDVAGRIRSTYQAVHDASTGRILYYAPNPARIETQLELLCGWLVSAAVREHAVVASGILHLELLRLHPFEAANGRLARIAARLALRARGLDPDGLAAAEQALALAPLGTYEEVARTARRRDATIWLERWGEAVAAGLRTSARRLAVLPAAVPERAERFCARRSVAGFTIVDYRAEAEAGPEDARSDLRALLDAGRVRRIAGSRGLRYELVRPDATEPLAEAN